MEQQTTREAVLAAVRRNPQLNTQELARELGVSRERVRKLLHALGYQLQWRKGKPTKGA